MLVTRLILWKYSGALHPDCHTDLAGNLRSQILPPVPPSTSTVIPLGWRPQERKNYKFWLLVSGSPPEMTATVIMLPIMSHAPSSMPGCPCSKAAVLRARVCQNHLESFSFRAETPFQRGSGSLPTGFWVMLRATSGIFRLWRLLTPRHMQRYEAH